MDRLKLAIESLQTHIDYDNRAKGMQTGLITIGIAEAEAILELLKEQETELCDRCGRRRMKSSKEGR